MKIAVCIATQDLDSFGYLQRYAEQFAKTAKARGVDVEVLRYPEPDFYQRLVANLADENCIVHFYGYLFDFNFPGRLNGGKDDLNVIDYSKATTVATIGDHPFSTFMHGTVKHAHPRTKFIVMERSFRDEMEAMNPTLSDSVFDHQPIPPPTNFDRQRVISFKDRAFDLVVPLYIADISKRDINFVLSQLTSEWFSKVIEATYEASRTVFDKSPFHIFCELFSTHVGITLDEVRERNPSLMPQILTAIAAVDGIIRQERRQAMVSSLLKSVDGLKVAITCDPVPGMEVDERVNFVGPCQVEDVATLMGDARATLNCNPSYPSSLHERVVSSMHYESCVITDVNRCIRERFSTDEFIPYAPTSAMTIADIYQAYDIEGIAAAAGKKIGGDRSYTWNGHIDRLMHAAAA